jgi:hypothetical protein
MPCQSYDNSWDDGGDARKIRELKKQADMLARIACKALTELEKNEVEDMLLLKDDEVRTWWKKHKEDDAREQARLAEIERKERIKAEALASLSDEAKELLGLKKPAPKKKFSNIGVWDEVYSTLEADELEEDDDGEYAEDTEYPEYSQQLLEELHKLTDGTVIKTFKVK